VLATDPTFAIDLFRAHLDAQGGSVFLSVSDQIN
jgi:hypothetical protein